MICVGVIGATGYVGVELIRLLLKHPNVHKILLSSVSFEGKHIEDIYPNFRGVLAPKCDGTLFHADDVVKNADVIFTALPHGLAEQYAICGKNLIDLSADFRFGEDEATFKKWYKADWKHPSVHVESVYGLPEMNRELIKKARIIGNPGCYVTATTLALLPALTRGILCTSPIIADCKSGVTGTGKNPSAINNFSECGESCSAYGIGSHRHQPEIARNLAQAAGEAVSIIFTPHLLPMSRGIIATIYAPLKTEFMAQVKNDEIVAYTHTLYTDFYKTEPFVRVLPCGKTPQTKNVRGTNFCDISVHIVQDGRMLEIVSVLDNMIKGASGQAIQNMNLMYNFAENAGLDLIPTAF